MKPSAITLILGLFINATALAGPEPELVINGSLEQTAHNFPAAWERTEDEKNRVTASWTVEEDPANGKVLKIDCTALPKPAAGTAGASYADVLQRNVTLAGGQKYTLTFKARGTGIADKAFSVQMQDTRDPATPAFQTTVNATTGWKEHRFEFTPRIDVPREASVLRFVLESTGTLWLDDISLRGDTDVIVDKAVVVSKMQPRLARLVAKNLVPNGSFECGADGWLSLGLPVGWGAGLTGLYGSVETGQSPQGSRAYRLTLGPGLTPESHFDFWPPEHLVQGRLLAANRGWIEVEPSRPYTLSAYMRSDKPGTKGVLQLNFNGDAQKAVQRLSKEVELTDQWQRYSYTVIAPEDGVFVAVGPDVRNAPTSATITTWVDAIQLEVGETATPFAPREPVELGFNSGQYGNVFAGGAPAVIDMTTYNATGTPAILAVGVRITDYWEQSLPPQNFTLVIPAGGRIARPLPLDLPPGFYRAHFSWTTEGREHTQVVQLAVIEPYPHADSPFGLNHAPTSVEACRQHKLAGVTWARDWAVNWECAEPRPGEISFATIDPHIERLHAAGMNVLSLIPSQPSTSWSSEAPDSVLNRSYYRQAYAPKDPKLLFDFIAKAAAHYKGSVAYWEFLNEPLWVPDFCLPKKGGYTIDTYLGLLKTAAATIRAADPDAKILGGLAIQPEILFGDEFIKAGGLDYVDIFNLHPYPNKRAPETFIANMERIRQMMDDYGVRKRIWATETSYWGVDEFPYLPWQPPADDWVAARLLGSARQTGDYLVRFSTILMAYGVDKIFWHAPVTGDVNDCRGDMGNVFLGQGGVPRKTYVTVSALANVMGPKPVYGGKWQIPKEVSGHATGNVYGYTFACGDHSLLVAWATEAEGAEAWALTLPAQATARSVTGAPLKGDKVMLSESPVYILSKIHTPGELARQCGLASP